MSLFTYKEIYILNMDLKLNAVQSGGRQSSGALGKNLELEHFMFLISPYSNKCIFEYQSKANCISRLRQMIIWLVT